MGSSGTMETLVELNSINKSFGSLKVLRNVSLSLTRGSIHALMGENGAGKSTLMKILAGVFPQTSGSVSVLGKEVNLHSPKDAWRLGISTVFQEFTLIPNLTIAENMFLGHEPRRRDGSIDRQQVHIRSQSLLSAVFPELDAAMIIEKLTVAQQQAVEIAKGLTASADVFIFDEPTAALNSADVEHLFKVIRSLRDQGKGIVYISHRMNEVFELSDMVTVLKDGALVRTAPTRDFNIHSLVSAMVGRELQSFYPPRSAGIGDDMLAVNGVRLSSDAKTVSFNVRKGEIIGLAGLEGQGQREIMRAIVGVDQVSGTEVERRNAGTGELTPIDVSRGFGAAINSGLGFIPEDRKLEGLFLNLSVFDNIALGKQLNRPFFSFAWRKVVELREKIRALRIVVADPNGIVGRLSGGNQQKVLLARWLLSGVDILVIEEPTRGVDVGAKADIYRLLRDFTDRGGAAIVSSRELVELIGLCDNLLVIHNKGIVATMPADGATEESVLGAALNASARAPEQLGIQ
jgi:ribose transport system ATP-binding protein